ncbi:hypothetical protein V7T21_17780, partial [Segatella copri]|uniref:hypothetical protein n=1 Tax=Segatella copri TaxID=165179 RepID=UPI002FF30A6D
NIETYFLTDGKSSNSIYLISCYCFFLNYARYKRGAAYLRFGYQRTRMSGMIMALPEVVTSSTSQGSSSTAMSLWHKPSSYLKRLVAVSRHRFRIIIIKG